MNRESKVKDDDKLEVGSRRMFNIQAISNTNLESLYLNM